MQISNPLEDEKFGVTLYLFDCAFSAELYRASISQVMEEIESQLNEDGAPEDSNARIEMMMDNAATISSMVANRQIGHTEGVADIAYSFIYAFGKSVGFEQLGLLRGLTGSFLRNVLSLNPCLGELEYQQETATLRRAMGEAEDGNWGEIEPAPRPTVH